MPSQAWPDTKFALTGIVVSRCGAKQRPEQAFSKGREGLGRGIMEWIGDSWYALFSLHS